MRKLIFLLLMLLHTISSAAQDETPNGSFTIVNETTIQIDTDVVSQVAQDFINTSRANVAIYVVATGNGEDFTKRLSGDGLAGDFNVNGNTFAIYVAVEPPYSEMRGGSNFDRLDLDTLRGTSLNPLLREGNFTQAFINTLVAVHQQMSNPFYGIGYYIKLVFTSPIFYMLLAVVGAAYVLNKIGFSNAKEPAPAKRSSGSSRNERTQTESKPRRNRKV
jgi:hypothetical protein